MAELGWQPVAIVVLSVVLTIGVSMLAARLMGFQSLFGLLSGGATAICGASAALALSAALPAHPQKERATLFTVIGVSALSTLAMIVYPMLAQRARPRRARRPASSSAPRSTTWRRWSAPATACRTETGDVATLVKLMRVAMLLPVIVFAVMLTRARAAPARPAARARRCCRGSRSASRCWWRSTAPAGCRRRVTQAGSEVSRWCLVAAIAGIGMKTQLKELATVGLKPVLLMLGETVFLAALVLALLLRWHAPDPTLTGDCTMQRRHFIHRLLRAARRWRRRRHLALLAPPAQAPGLADQAGARRRRRPGRRHRRHRRAPARRPAGQGDSARP